MEESLPTLLRAPFRFRRALLFVSVVLLFSALLSDPTIAWISLLTAGLFAFSIVVGASLFAAIQVVSGARWWTPIIPITQIIASRIAVAALLLLGCATLGLHTLYPWSHPEHIPAAKALWLNQPFFIARAVFLLAGFAFLAHRLHNALSRSHKPSLRPAVLYIIFYALFGSVAFWDWLMSLSPHWYSTMFAVYGFSNVILCGIATVTILAVLTNHANHERRVGVYHDLGKFLFGFSFFWAYIWFCQYMLIWYANIPEEVVYFQTRLSGEWGMFFWLNPILGFILPFVLLLRRSAKENPTLLLQVALLVLFARWYDLFLQVAPSVVDHPPSPVYPLAALILCLVLLTLRLPFGQKSSAKTQPSGPKVAPSML